MSKTQTRRGTIKKISELQNSRVIRHGEAFSYNFWALLITISREPGCAKNRS